MNKLIIFTEVILATLMLLLPTIIYPQQLSLYMAQLSHQIGVTFYYQLALASYIIGGLIILALEHQQITRQLKHLKILSELCLLLGMIGTYVALINGIKNGIPSVSDLSHTFYSTFLGLVTVAFTSFFSEIIRYTHLNTEVNQPALGLVNLIKRRP